MGRTTLRRRLTLLFGVTIFIVLFLVGWILSAQSRRVLINQAGLTAQALARSIAASSSNDFFSYNYVALEQKAEEAIKEPEVAYVLFYDKEGRTVASPGLGVPGQEGGLEGLSDGLQEGIPVQGTRMRLMEGFSGPGLEVVVAVGMPGSDQPWGFVRLGMRLDSIHRQIGRMRLTIFVLGLSGLLLAWAMAAYFTRRITIPLQGLVDAAERVSEGDLDARIAVHTGDEIQNLADRFNWMVGSIKLQRDTLEDNIREIRNLKHYSDLILLSMTNALVALDGAGALTTFNRKAEELFDVPAEAALSQTPEALWAAQPEIAGILRQGVLEGVTVDGAEVSWTGAGQKRVLELSTALIREDGDDKPVGLIALFTDLTEKKDLEEKVRRADRLAAMGTLAAGLAHEIKNPLTAIRAFVQMLPSRYEQDAYREKFSRIVPRELDRVNNLLEDLLDLVRKPRIQMAAIDLPSVIKGVLETLEPEVEKRQIQVNLSFTEGSLRVMADESYLARALHNIILNSVQAMPGGGVVTVEARRKPSSGTGPSIETFIADTGSGIPADQIDQIFNPFFTSKEKGTGLGLAVTNKIIEDLGGTISVDSGRGVGTSFSIALAAADPV